MNTGEQRIAIAKTLGWKPYKNYWKSPAFKRGDALRMLPDFSGSLDAMHEAEKVLDGAQCADYHKMLDRAQAEETQERNGDIEYPAQDFWFHATASQRAEAFLRTLDLWQD